MHKLIYILLSCITLGFISCEQYIDITPTGKKRLIQQPLIMT